MMSLLMDKSTLYHVNSLKSQELIWRHMPRKLTSQWPKNGPVGMTITHLYPSFVTRLWTLLMHAAYKWKIVEGKKVIKSRLCVRGFKDQQWDHVTTSASTAARWTQRMVCSVAANHGWKISIADVNAAFLKGMSFEEMAQILGEKLRVVHLNPPKGSW